MSTSTAVIAAMAAQRRKLARYFIQSRALSAETAVTRESLPTNRFRLLEKFQRQGIVLSTPEGKLYLDQARLEAVQAAARATTRRMLVIVISIFAMATILFAGLGYFFGSA